MTNILLGLIALGTVTTAVVEIIVIVSLARTARRVRRRVERIRGQAAGLAGHLASIREHVSRAQSLASVQIERVFSVYSAIEGPLSLSLTAMAVARSVASVLRRTRP